MKKSDIEFHSDRGPRLPAINVKVRRFLPVSEIAEHFKCSESVAEQAGEYHFNSACEQFWEQAQELADHYLGKTFGSCKVYSQGRSNGWLVVKGLPDVESWEALAVSAWSQFAKAVRADVDWRMAKERAFDAIETNQWAKEGAEEYNFIDGEDGKPVCIADMKAQAVAAGFGPILRK